jgi:hypothetical protein
MKKWQSLQQQLNFLFYRKHTAIGRERKKVFTLKFKTSCWCCNAQRNDTQHNDTQHNDSQHNNTQHNDTQHNDTQHNDTKHSNKKWYVK